jgi:hypothetical protein
MREKIFMFLFFFMLLLSIYIYINAQKTLMLKDAEINKLQDQLEACE